MKKLLVLAMFLPFLQADAQKLITNNTDTPVSVIDGFRAMDVAHQILEKISKAGHN